MNIATDFPLTYRYVTDYTNQALLKTQSFLRTKGKNATGNLINTLGTKVEINSQGASIALTFAKYGIFVNDGRRRGAKQPPMASILSWIQTKGIRPRNNVSINSLAFMIARSISIKGIKPVKFIQFFNAQMVNPTFRTNVNDNIRKDIENQLKKK